MKANIEFSLEEAAFWALTLVFVKHVPGPVDLRLEDIVSTEDNNQLVHVPSDKKVLARKVEVLSDDEQQNLRDCFDRLSALPAEDQGRMHGIIDDWVHQKDEQESMEFLRRRLVDVGIHIV